MSIKSVSAVHERHPDSIFLGEIDLPTLFASFLETHCASDLKPTTARQYRATLETTLSITYGTPFYQGCTNLQDSRLAIKAFMMGCKIEYPVKFNRWKATLSSCFGWGIEEDLIGANPVYRIPSAPENPRTRLFTDNELRKWFRVTRQNGYSQRTVDGLFLILLTGMRPGEVLSLRPRDINQEDRAVYLEETKNGKPHLIPLSSLALELLKGNQQEVAENQKIFSTSLNGLGQVCRRASQRAEITRCSPHDLRRTCATLCGRLGVPIETISRILNHSVGGVKTRHYALYAYEREKREALELVANHLSTLGMKA